MQRLAWRMLWRKPKQKPKNNLLNNAVRQPEPENSPQRKEEVQNFTVKKPVITASFKWLLALPLGEAMQIQSTGICI